MKFNLVFTSLLFLISCQSESNRQKNSDLPIIGTWQLISAKTIHGDSTYTDDLSDKKMIKIINETHFSFLNHDLPTENDSLDFFVAGGGNYSLKGDQYTEHLEYCNFRQWEGNTFHFTVKINGDTLIQRGIEEIENLNVDREIIETYLKAE